MRIPASIVVVATSARPEEDEVEQDRGTVPSKESARDISPSLRLI